MLLAAYCSEGHLNIPLAKRLNIVEAEAARSNNFNKHEKHQRDTIDIFIVVVPHT